MLLKGNFCLYPLPDDPGVPLPPRIMQSLPPSGPVECIVRVYVIKAVDLQPHDPGGSVRSALLDFIETSAITDSLSHDINAAKPGFSMNSAARLPFVIHKLVG